mgnify:CR=1 FL=1|tara:strand:- start:385 stop:1167 length:783 start_codon:yes stop_codon:yes gene_type:complete
MKLLGNPTLTALNGRTVRLSGDLSGCVITRGEHTADIEEISYIKDDDEFSICKGSVIRPKPKTPYKVNLIRAMYGNNTLMYFDLVTAVRTSASTFALPFLGGNRAKSLWSQQLVNVFTRTEEHPSCIALLYRFSGTKAFAKFESELCKHKDFVHRYDPDPFQVLFVFNVPRECEASYEHYVNGKYSQIDGLWKLKILDFHGFDMDGHTGKILYQSPELRKTLETSLDVNLGKGCELHSIPNRRTEMFDPDVYTIHSKVRI